MHVNYVMECLKVEEKQRNTWDKDTKNNDIQITFIIIYLCSGFKCSFKLFSKQEF